MGTNVCIYARVSTDVQDYQRQIEDIKKECKKHNYTIVKEFSEKESGKHKQRKALNEMLAYCKEHQDALTFVIISELSRLGRTGQVIFTIETLNEYKIGLISIKEKLQTLNEDKTLNLNSSLLIPILSAINSYELDTTKYRSKSGLLHSAKQGNWGGGNRLPYGYMREGKKLVINPVEEVIIKEIFGMYKQGKGTLSIATLLNGRQVPTRTGVKWRDKVVYDIVCNPIYCGKRRFKGEILAAPSIITEELFNSVSHIRTSNYSKLGINSKFEYLLNDRLIKCGVCGKSYFAHRRSNGKDSAYKCISIRYGDNCGNTSISIDKLENAVTQIFLFKFVQLLKLEGDNSEEIKSENLIYEQELKKIKQQSKKLLDLYLESENPSAKTEYNIKKEELRLQEKKIEDLKQANIDRINDLTKAKELIKKIKIENVGSYFEIFQITKDMIQQIIKNIVITKDTKVLSSNPMDKTVRVDIISITGSTITIYLSQRAKFFLWNDNEVEYTDLKGTIQATGD